MHNDVGIGIMNPAEGMFYVRVTETRYAEIILHLFCNRFERNFGLHYTLVLPKFKQKSNKREKKFEEFAFPSNTGSWFTEAVAFARQKLRVMGSKKVKESFITCLLVRLTLTKRLSLNQRKDMFCGPRASQDRMKSSPSLIVSERRLLDTV